MVQKGTAGMRFVAGASRQGRHSRSAKKMWTDSDTNGHLGGVGFASRSPRPAFNVLSQTRLEATNGPASLYEACPVPESLDLASQEIETFRILAASLGRRRGSIGIALAGEFILPPYVDFDGGNIRAVPPQNSVLVTAKILKKIAAQAARRVRRTLSKRRSPVSL
jgi:hypothetical protein